MVGFIGILDVMQDTSKVLLGFLFAWLIFYIQQRYSEKKEKETVIKAFGVEIRRNALTCEIAIKDETKIMPFDLDSWAKIKTGNYIQLRREIVLYIYEIENVNRLINDFRSYEKNYTAGDIPIPMVKTQDDMILETKRDRVKHALTELQNTIDIADDTLQKQMVGK